MELGFEYQKGSLQSVLIENFRQRLVSKYTILSDLEDRLELSYQLYSIPKDEVRIKDQMIYLYREQRKYETDFYRYIRTHLYDYPLVQNRIKSDMIDALFLRLHWLTEITYNSGSEPVIRENVKSNAEWLEHSKKLLDSYFNMKLSVPTSKHYPDMMQRSVIAYIFNKLNQKGFFAGEQTDLGLAEIIESLTGYSKTNLRSDISEFRGKSDLFSKLKMKDATQRRESEAELEIVKGMCEEIVNEIDLAIKAF